MHRTASIIRIIPYPRQPPLFPSSQYFHLHHLYPLIPNCLPQLYRFLLLIGNPQNWVLLLFTHTCPVTEFPRKKSKSRFFLRKMRSPHDSGWSWSGILQQAFLFGKAVPWPYSGRAKRQMSGNRSAGIGKLLCMVGTTQSCKKKQAGKSCDIRKKT